MAEPQPATLAQWPRRSGMCCWPPSCTCQAPRPGFVLRPRLMEALEEGLGRGLILVCAPAGFGKTALLADWARRSQRPAAWLSLDAGDDDPARFWRHAVAALDRARPGSRIGSARCSGRLCRRHSRGW
jgi:ATP/maltotriose-dependent transcriptional regulator MalT